MKIQKKYKFESSFVDKDGIQGSSFEMFVTFESITPEKTYDTVEKFTEAFDHSIMFSDNDPEFEFLNNSSERKIILQSIEKNEISPYIYAYLTVFSIQPKEKDYLFEIKVSDSKDTTYIITQKEIQNMHLYNFNPKFTITNGN